MLVPVRWCSLWVSLGILVTSACYSASFSSSWPTRLSMRHRPTSTLSPSHKSQSRLSPSNAMQEYCELVEQSITSQHFISLHLQGPSKKAASKEELRGSITRIRGRLVSGAASSKARTSSLSLLPRIGKENMEPNYSNCWKRLKIAALSLPTNLNGECGTQVGLNWDCDPAL